MLLAAFIPQLAFFEPSPSVDRLVMKFSIVFALAVTAAATLEAEALPMIIGGTEVPVGEKTWMVGMRQSLTERTRCGGMLIAPTKVLTAAHCRVFKAAAIGTHFNVNGTDGELIEIVNELNHPKYTADDISASYDFRIVTLAKPSTIEPVPILAENPTLAPIPGMFATVIGWGNQREENGTHESRSPVLRRVDVQVRSMDECAAMGMKPLDESMVCAGGVEGEDTCNGDSGGPLHLETPRGDAVFGVVSWGNGCALKDQPGVYARIHTVLDWIKENAPGVKFVTAWGEAAAVAEKPVAGGEQPGAVTPEPVRVTAEPVRPAC